MNEKLERLWTAIVEHTQDDEMFALGMLLLCEIHKQTGFFPAGYDAKMASVVRAMSDSEDLTN